MKTIALLAALLAAGCTHIKVTKTAADGTTVTLNATTLFSNAAVKGLALDATTKTTTNLLRVAGAASEPNPDSITATGAALGELIGTAAKAAATK